MKLNWKRAFSTASSAEAYARKMGVPNAIPSSQRNLDGSFSPVILMRPDQVFMKERIEEREIVVKFIQPLVDY